jgi:hypothetical protein
MEEKKRQTRATAKGCRTGYRGKHRGGNCDQRRARQVLSFDARKGLQISGAPLYLPAWYGLVVYPPELEESPADWGDGNVEGSEGSYSFGGSANCWPLARLYVISLEPGIRLGSFALRLFKKKARAPRAASPMIPPTTPTEKIDTSVRSQSHTGDAVCTHLQQ